MIFCDLPETHTCGQQGESFIRGLAPREVYPAAPVAKAPGGLLHRHFTLILADGILFCDTICQRFFPFGFFPLPGFDKLSRHAALWSSDFPHSSEDERDRPMTSTIYFFLAQEVRLRYSSVSSSASIS